MKRRISAIIVVVGLTVSLLVGCGQTENTDIQAAESAPAAEQTEAIPEVTPKETEEPEHTHNYTEEITTAASCEGVGLKTFTCECGDTYTEEITATGHIFENYASNGDATYLADGTETATCNGCELTDTRTVEGSKLEYTYTDMEATMYAQQTVNVRDIPSTDGNKVGSLSANDEVKVTGQAETGWYRIEYDGGVAYVSDSYLSEDKVEVVQAANVGSTNNASLPPCPYTLHTWTRETSAEGCPMFVIYTPYTNIGDIRWGSPTPTPDILQENANGDSMIWDAVSDFANAHGCGFHFLYPVTKVGDYAEGTIYKCIASAHFTTGGACQIFDGTCQAGTVD